MNEPIELRPAGNIKAGEIEIRQIAGNQNGNVDQLYVLAGDVVVQSVNKLIARTKNDFPLNRSVSTNKLKLFHFNDMHNHFCDLADNGRHIQRFAQMQHIVTNARKQADDKTAVLFLSAGDDHTGTVFDELIGWNTNEFIVDASYKLFSLGGVDIATIGNHEFDRGAKLLAKGITTNANFPLISANVHRSAHLHVGKDYYPAVLAVVKGLKIGVVGLTTHIETRVGQPDDPTLSVASPISTLQNILPTLSKISDIIVILSHCGYGDGNHASGKAMVARDIGEADFSIAKIAGKLTDKPTVLIGAHTHTRLNEHGAEAENYIGDILINQAECNGRYLGEVTMDFNNEKFEVTSQLHAIESSFEGQSGKFDQRFVDQNVTPLINLVEKNMDVVIAQVLSDDIDRTSTLQARYCRETHLANFMNDGLVLQLNRSGNGKPDLALLNAASILTGHDVGPLTYRQWFDVMPYSDEIFIMTMTGREIEAVLQNNAKRILRPSEVVDPNSFVARGFLHCSSGIRYDLNLAKSAKQAFANNITILNQPVLEVYEQSFQVAVTTYLALGSFGERWNGKTIAGGVEGDVPGYDLRELPSYNTGLVYRNEMVAFIRDHNEISAKLGARLDGRLRVI